MSQVNCKIEIVVCEEYSESPVFYDLIKENQIKYLKIKSNKENLFSISNVRNWGLINSTGEFVCMLDADVIFSHENCMNMIANMFIQAGHELLTTPLLRHISPVDAKRWVGCVKSGKGLYSFLEKCKIIDDHIYSFSVDENRLVVVQHPYDKNKFNRKYIIDFDDWSDFKSDPVKWTGLEPTIFTPCVQKGFLFTSRNNLLSVGGYCEKYSGWGGEDSDLKWKLHSASQEFILHQDPQISLIHVHHKKPYYSRTRYITNKTIFGLRKERGVQVAIDEDAYQLKLKYKEN